MITERKKATEQLSFQAQVLENVSDAIIASDQQSRITYWNIAAEDLFGYTAAEVLGKKTSQVLGSTLPPQERKTDDQVLDPTGKNEIEVTCTNKAGQRLVVARRQVALTGPDGTVSGYISSSRDITRRHAAEEALAQSERVRIEANERFRLVWEIAADGMALSDEQGTVLAANPAYYRLYGYSAEEVLGHNFAIIYPEDARESANQKYQRIFHDPHAALEHKAAIQRADKTMRMVDSHIGFILKDGQRTAMLSVIRDTTEEEAHEQRLIENKTLLKENEQRFRVALSMLELTVFAADRDLRYTWVYNARPKPGMEEMLGKRDDEFFPKDTHTEIIQLKKSVIDTGQGLQREVKIFLSGDWRYFLMTLEPVGDDSGNVIGLLGSLLDVTEQRRLEIEHHEGVMEREVHHRLMEYREMERQSIARDLHDGPIQSLSSLTFNIQLLKEAFSDPTLLVELEQIGLKVKDTIGELREMVNELRPPSLIRFGLAKAIRMHAEELQERQPEIEITFDLTDDGGILSEQACLNLFRIYQEGLNNVLRHSAATRVWVRYQASQDTFTLELHDNGRGFPVVNDLTSLTRRGHFGLAGMKERADILGGKLSFSSEEGQGTHIEIVGPLSARNLK
ncbi:MAG: PAS domain S-box protein [Anaerolineaceae bacterium]|nr:PAS domain S-box protein [Anaerolineaceae bacterium]